MKKISKIKKYIKTSIILYLFSCMIVSWITFELINPFQLIIDFPTYENHVRFAVLAYAPVFIFFVWLLTEAFKK